MGYIYENYIKYLNIYNKTDIKQYLTKIALICNHDIISSKTPNINGVFVISLAFVITGIFLCRWVYFHLTLHGIVTNRPFMHLKNITKLAVITLNVKSITVV